jgi:hypothetical protein
VFNENSDFEISNLKLGENTLPNIYFGECFRKEIKSKHESIRIEFYRHSVFITHDNPFDQNEIFTIKVNRINKTGVLFLSTTWFDNRKICGFVEQDFDKLSHYRVHFTIKQWKNSVFTYRKQAETFVASMLAVLIGQLVPIHKLCYDDHIKYRKLDNLPFKLGDFDKHFILHFSTTSPIEERECVNIHGTHLLKSAFLQYAVSNLNKHGQEIEHIKFIMVEKPEKFFLVDNSLSTTYTHWLYIKPNGLRHLDIFFNLLKFNIFSIGRIIVCEPTNDVIKYFYSNAHKYQYGQHWYSYLQSNLALMIEFDSDLGLNEMAAIKTKFRNLSGLNWTLNVCHGAITEQELEHFKNFFDNKYLNLDIPKFDI